MKPLPQVPQGSNITTRTCKNKFEYFFRWKYQIKRNVCSFKSLYPPEIIPMKYICVVSHTYIKYLNQ